MMDRILRLSWKVEFAMVLGLARTRQLWPLIVAHAILDFNALAARVG